MPGTAKCPYCGHAGHGAETCNSARAIAERGKGVRMQYGRRKQRPKRADERQRQRIADILDEIRREAREGRDGTT